MTDSVKALADAREVIRAAISRLTNADLAIKDAAQGDLQAGEEAINMLRAAVTQTKGALSLVENGKIDAS